MACYEYFCDSCKKIFEEILLNPADLEKYSKEYPCSCKRMAARVPISITNFVFKGPAGPVQGSGVHGQSGSHDLDYPSLDKAIGRSSEKKWIEANKKKAARDKVRRQTGTNSISTAGGNISPVSSGVMKQRSLGLTTMSKAKKSNP